MLALTPLEVAISCLWLAGIAAGVYAVRRSHGSAWAIIALLFSLAPLVGWLAPTLGLILNRGDHGRRSMASKA